MIEFYPQIKLAHIAAVAASGALFFLRGAAVQLGAEWAMAAPLRYLSYTIDSVLLTAALMLATMLHQYPFVDAWLTVQPDDRQGARGLLEGLLDHLGDACVGSISEVFDAEDPFTARGCIAQAWSVAEVLRCWVKTAGP